MVPRCSHRQDRCGCREAAWRVLEWKGARNEQTAIYIDRSVIHRRLLFDGIGAGSQLAVRRNRPIQDGRREPLPAAIDRSAGGGRRSVMDLGCVYCHTQQVRPEGFGADIERGWGRRRTVMRDYLYDPINLMGTMRTGPDLANIGARQPSKTWQYLHLYNPQITSPGSIMPPHPFLFTVGADPGGPPFDGVALPAEWQTPTAKYIVPNARGRFLVEYLLSLDKRAALPEAE
ncbi:MAG: cbb3-type cytochrome c oxidase subunit II [Bryobacterales bacterium]|nr:cbb3-type cytochrome c oxidase subunit II [Bryobacterales bacterium]